MTNGPDGPSRSQPAAEEQAEYARRQAAADHRYHHVPARDPAERAEYDRQEADEAAAEEAGERFIHFYGIHVQDPGVAHGDCVDYCPYDTLEQAKERAERRAYVEAMEAGYASENNGGNITGPEDSFGEWAEPDPEDVAAYDELHAALQAQEAARQDARAASHAHKEALTARQEAPWPSQAYEEASARVASASHADLAAREAYQAARLAATSIAWVNRARRAAPKTRAVTDGAAVRGPDAVAQRSATRAARPEQVTQAQRPQQYGARPEDHAPPQDRRPPAEPGHDSPVPRM